MLDKEPQSPANQLESLWKILQRLKGSLVQLQNYPGHTFYQTKMAGDTKELNRAFVFLKSDINKSSNSDAKEAVAKVRGWIENVVSRDTDNIAKMRAIEKIEMLWPELEISLRVPSGTAGTLIIPKEILDSPYGVDMREADIDFANKCFSSSMVACRRAYETGLADLYRKKEGKEPVEDQTCPHCGKVIQKDAYMGIMKLHKWAVAKSYVSSRLRNVGYVVSEMGAGGAHPSNSDFSQSPEAARLGADAAVALLKEVLTAMKFSQPTRE